MRIARTLLTGAAALVLAVGLWGCKSPFDPIDKSPIIQGLTFVDFSLTWDRWDADPEYDGVVVEMDYYNEYGDSLEFINKPHTLVIEFWTQKTAGPEESEFNTFNKLIYSRTLNYENSDDQIRIPIEAYLGALQKANLNTDDSVDLYVIVRVFPPQAFPRRELVVGYADMTVYKASTDGIEPND